VAPQLVASEERFIFVGFIESVGLSLEMVVEYYYYHYSVALVRERTIRTDRPPLVGEVSANFWVVEYFKE
jgi:hypothetical protein